VEVVVGCLVPDLEVVCAWSERRDERTVRVSQVDGRIGADGSDEQRFTDGVNRTRQREHGDDDE
jgi:hypothetical protein